jgi:hypothetical protein
LGCGRIPSILNICELLRIVANGCKYPTSGQGRRFALRPQGP